MIRIFPDFSVQVTASAAGGAGAGGAGGGGGGMVTGPPVGRVPGATNGTPQSVQGIGAYQPRYDLWRHKHPFNSLQPLPRKTLFHLISS